jgi:hypothetical protein
MFSRNLFPPSSGLRSAKLGSGWVTYEEQRVKAAEGRGETQTEMVLIQNSKNESPHKDMGRGTLHETVYNSSNGK